MSYDYAASHVWLGDHPGAVVPGTGYSLCERHAAMVAAPRGWTLTDHRSSIGPRLDQAVA